MPPFTDPGAAGLTAAQLRAQTALATFAQVGDETANQINLAAAEASGEEPGITTLEQYDQFLNKFGEGVLLQVWDTLVGVWEMSPFKFMLDGMLRGDHYNKWQTEYVKMWSGLINEIITDPEGTGKAIIEDFFAADQWDEYAGEGVGRVTVNVALLLLGGASAIKTLKTLANLRKGPTPNTIDPAPLVKPSPVDPNKPGGDLFPDKFKPLGGLTPEQFIAKWWDPDKVNDWDGSTGGWKYPDNDGFDTSPGAPPITTLTNIKPGATFDRFGDPNGRYVSPEGIPYPDRALPPDSINKPYHIYELLKPFDDISGYPQGGRAAPTFEQPGLGTQIKLPQEIEWLEDNGYIKDITP